MNSPSPGFDEIFAGVRVPFGEKKLTKLSKPMEHTRQRRLQQELRDRSAMKLHGVSTCFKISKHSCSVYRVIFDYLFKEEFVPA